MSSTQLFSPSQSASDELADVVRKALDRSNEPLPVSKLMKQLTGPFRRSAAELNEVLAGQVAAGHVHRYPKFRGAERFWTKDPETYAKGTLLHFLAARPLTRAELKQKCKARLQGLSDKRRGEILDSLVRQGDAFKLPPLLGTKTERFSARPVDAYDYVEDAVDRIGKLLAKAGARSADVLAAVQEFARRNPSPSDVATPAAPRPTPTHTAATVSQTARPAAPSRDLTEALVERMAAVNPRAVEGAMVSIPELRRSMEFLDLDRDEFDRAVWQLNRDGRVWLAKHDSPATLPPEQRAELVSDGNGYYYNGISLRQPR